MIDIENLIFTDLKETVGELIKGSSTTKPNTPPKFPFLCVEQKDNPVDVRYTDSSGLENAVQPLFEINIFTKGDTKKTNAKKIMSEVCDRMRELGFTRITGPYEIENLVDESVCRYVARFRSVVDNNKTIYSI